MAQISKNTTIGELLNIYPEAAPILMEKMCIRDSTCSAQCSGPTI